MCYVTWSESFPPSLWNTLVLVNHSLYSSSCSSVSGNLNDLMFVFFLCLSYCAFLHTGIQPYFPFHQLQIVLVILSLYFQSISRLPSWIWVFAIIQWSSFIYKISCLVLLPCFYTRKNVTVCYVKQIQIQSLAFLLFSLFDMNAEF